MADSNIEEMIRKLYFPGQSSIQIVDNIYSQIEKNLTAEERYAVLCFLYEC